MNGQSLNSSALKRSWGNSLQREVQICVVGKVFRPNRSKVLALNKTLSEYFKIVKWYLSCNSKSKKFLHEKCYEDAKRLFNLNTALIQTARDKAVEILKSFGKRCRHVAQVNGREFKCPTCGMEYNGDLNIAHALTRGMGWGSCEPPEPADEVGGVKPQLNAGSSRL
jgi:hypothetical protein